MVVFPRHSSSASPPARRRSFRRVISAFAAGGTACGRLGCCSACSSPALAGSTMHCVPMCGGFVLGQVADGMARLPATRLCEWQRVSRGALLPYHLGRLTTYAGLGALRRAAALGRLPWFGAVSGVLLLLGAALFLAQVARVLPGLDRAPAGWTRAIARLARRTSGGYPLGIGTRLPALRFPLRRAGRQRGKRQPGVRRPRHAALRAWHRSGAGGGRHSRTGGGTPLASRQPPPPHRW